MATLGREVARDILSAPTKSVHESHSRDDLHAQRNCDASFPPMIRRLRLPQTLRARLTGAFALLLLLAAVCVSLVLARQTAHTQLAAQERLGASVIDMITPALQGMIDGGQVFGLDGYVSRVAADPTIAAIR